MSESEQRKQRSDHMKDEAIALEVQQRSAGETHSPVPRWSGDFEDPEAAIAAAVAAERQRCAGIADSWADEARLLRAFPGFSEMELAAAVAAVRAVSAQIRDTAVP